MGTRRAAAVGLLLLAAFVVVVVVTTPWHPLPGAVPGGHVPADPSRDFTAAQIARESAYHSAVRPWSLSSLVPWLAVTVVLGFTSFGARAVDRLPFRNWLARIAVATAAYVAVVTVVLLPFDARVHAVRRDYGLSTQGWVSWFGDVGRAYGVGLVSTLLGVLAVMLLARLMPRRWWIASAAAGAALVIVGSFVYPLVVEPVFNKFQSLPAGPLRTQLLALAASDHIHLDDILVADASRRTTTDNAYVSGFGASRRLVLDDTLLRHDTPAEVRVITAHELGHVKNHDVLFGTLLGALAVAAAMCGAFVLFHDGARLPRRVGATGAADPRAVPLLLAMYAVVSFVVTPVSTLVSRHIEARADAHALTLTHDPADFISAQRKLAINGLDDLDPPTILYVLFDTHPTAPQRIAMARDYERQHPH
ncbi:MAG TPA: M48 family metallopeptidase [Mycobacteriales bacterium]|jgi:STE24 endopeptidase|nr:M48 family metallopeptidase [Mycobacteriales bacterium]